MTFSTSTRDRLWALLAMLTAAVLISACGAEHPGGPEPGAGQGFAILSSTGGLSLTDGKTTRRLGAFRTEAASWNGTSAAWRDANTAVVVSSSTIGIVTAAGEQATAPCAGCRGVAVVGDTVFTARTNYRAGDGFDIVEFDATLREVRSAPAQRVNERWLGVRNADDVRPPAVVAATKDAVYVSYISRSGGARHGPEIVAEYGWTGEQREYVLIDGQKIGYAVSPDARYLAMASGGSGGACRTTANLRVIDLRQMRELDTYPDRPLEHMVATGSLSEPWFFAEDLRWVAGEVVVTGQVHSLRPNEDCDPAPRSWTRRYQVESQSFIDTPADPIRATRVIGPTCTDLIGYSGLDNKRAVIGKSGGANTELATNAGILAATAGSLTC
ncbi:hypothetical protein ACFYO1_12045 [Nocardia sp. NPDC006044]|uniref:hypothetical protein n=1 Tax=Nocardia sp. NPDC006044 TaxID=3364306 RepID=UPI00367A65EA